ncbi:hypothetical protein F4824DRAFT_498353 [Ustulina deusta]|nr:hypothetical protein F4824DRAFT_498353 [Ustulina deusta]
MPRGRRFGYAPNILPGFRLHSQALVGHWVEVAKTATEFTDIDGSHVLGEPMRYDVEQQQTASPAQGDSEQNPANLLAWEAALPGRGGAREYAVWTGSVRPWHRKWHYRQDCLRKEWRFLQPTSALRRSEMLDGEQKKHLTNPVALNNFARQHVEEFDIITASMLLKELSDIKPLAEFLPTVLRPTGRVVMANLHLCFHGPGVRRVIEAIENPKISI